MSKIQLQYLALYSKDFTFLTANFHFDFDECHSHIAEICNARSTSNIVISDL
jgi:hypothetical protein